MLLNLTNQTTTRAEKNNMKTNHPNPLEITVNPAFKRFCLTSCRKLVAQLNRTKEALFRQFQRSFGAQEQLLRLALNEAEALAWQTAYPHLVFPALATEKAQAVATWDARQRLLQQTN